MNYDMIAALLRIVDAVLLNAPIVVTTISVSVLAITALDQLGLVRQPKKKKKKKSKKGE